MKTQILVLGILIAIFCACHKENGTPEQTDTFVVLGDPSATVTLLDTLIFPPERGDSIVFPIDLDDNGIKDFQFFIYYNYSPCVYMASFRMDCLHDSAKVCTPDTLLSPKVMEYGDTLQGNLPWASQKFVILSASGYSTLCGGDGIVYKYGDWYNLSDKYMGLLIEKKEYPVYGWVLLSIPDDDWIHSLTLHKTGWKKAAYKSPVKNKTNNT